MNDSNTDLTQHFIQKDNQPSNSQLSNNHAVVSVITTCYGRNRHLYNLLGSLEQGIVQPEEVIIVNDDADPKRLAEFSLNIIQIPTTVSDSTISSNIGSNSGSNSGLNTDANTGSTKASTSCAEPKFDIGHNRNLGAAKARHEALIFLDVDCIVAPDFIKQMSSKLQAQPDALIMGQPRYLTRPLTVEESTLLKNGDFSVQALNTLSVYNPYRFNFAPSDSGFSDYEDNFDDDKADDNVKNNQIDKVVTGSDKAAHVNVANTLLRESSQSNPSIPASTPMMKTDDYGAFWSLCFAITRQQFQNIGGFDTQYIGYGAEDTDFAFTARAKNIDFYLSADVVYHQQHSVYRPPLNHLDSIVINANRFYDKWQHWPMGGWLQQFADMGLIEWTEQQDEPIIVLRGPHEDELQSAHCPDAPFV